jgi:hypothetical protein
VMVSDVVGDDSSENHVDERDDLRVNVMVP